MQQAEEEWKTKYSDLEFMLAETNEKEIQSTQSLTVLQGKLRDLELLLNQAKEESDDQTLNLREELSKKDEEMNNVREELQGKTTTIGDLEFQIKKYVNIIIINILHIIYIYIHFYTFLCFIINYILVTFLYFDMIVPLFFHICLSCFIYFIDSLDLELLY